MSQRLHTLQSFMQSSLANSFLRKKKKQSQSISDSINLWGFSSFFKSKNPNSTFMPFNLNKNFLRVNAKFNSLLRLTYLLYLSFSLLRNQNPCSPTSYALNRTVTPSTGLPDDITLSMKPY